MWYRESSLCQKLYFAAYDDQITKIRSAGILLDDVCAGTFKDENKSIELFTSLESLRHANPWHSAIELNIPTPLVKTAQESSHLHRITYCNDIPKSYIAEIHPSLRNNIDNPTSETGIKHDEIFYRDEFGELRLNKQGKMLLSVVNNIQSDLQRVASDMEKYITDPKEGLLIGAEAQARKTANNIGFYKSIPGLNNFANSLDVLKVQKGAPPISHIEKINEWETTLRESCKSLLNVRLGFNNVYVYETHGLLSNALAQINETKKCNADDIFVFEFALRNCENSVRSASNTLDDQRSIITGWEDEGDRPIIENHRTGDGSASDVPLMHKSNNNDAKSNGFIRSFKRGF